MTKLEGKTIKRNGYKLDMVYLFISQGYFIDIIDIFVEDENIEPSKLVDLNIKERKLSFGVTLMNIRKGEIKHYYWIDEI